MSFRVSSCMLRSIFLFVAIAIPSAAWGQHNNKPSAPAPKPSAPAQHASAPAAHNNASAGANRPANNAQRPGNNSMNRPGNTGMNRTGNTAASRPGAGNTNRGNEGANHGAMNNRSGAGGNARGNERANSNMGNKAGAGNANRGAMSRTTGSHTPPGRQVSLKGGGSAHIRPNGQIRSIDHKGMHIEHGLHGERHISSTHNGARVVTTGKHGGYVQRNYVSRNGHSYVSRTYVSNNVTYTSVYRSYSYGGYCCYYGYAPAYYYQPAYYGWAYNPWPAPVAYGWGWGGAPWYGYYGAYYAPYPVYPSAAFWLTDYMIAASLQAAYEAQLNADLLDSTGSDFLVASMAPMAPPDSNVAMTKEVKNALAEEVKAQLAADQADASKSGSSASSSGGDQGGTLPALDPKRKTFVVSSELSVTADGEECSLTNGDIISRTSDTPDDDKNVTANVLASKKDDCAVGKEVAVSIDDLQEMHNKFREQVTNGMGEMAKKQGTGGLPKAPDTSTKDGEVPAPPADKSAAKALQDQQGEADQAEAEVKQEAGSSGSGGQQ